MLVRRLRRLEDFGLVAREPSPGQRARPYRLAPAGQRLVPTLQSLHEWAERWVPEDPLAAARRDPDVIGFWLKLRVDRRNLPDPPVVVAFSLGDDPARQVWLVLERAATPSLCAEDPCLSPDRYVHVEADAAALYPISRGARDWQGAIADRSVRLYGTPELVRSLPTWFLHPDAGA